MNANRLAVALPILFVFTFGGAIRICVARRSQSHHSSEVGRVAVVTCNNAGIYGEPSLQSLRSICAKGQSIAVIAESSTQYQVLMADQSAGYILKSSVKLLSGAINVSPVISAGSGPLGRELTRTAETYLGVPYLWGGTSARGIDCSGFVQAVFRQHAINLPRVAREQVNIGADIPREAVGSWTAGDRLYFACHHGSLIDHTAMYIGGGYFIHASVGHGGHVAIDPVANRYYYAHLVGVRRSHELNNLTWTQPRQAIAPFTPAPITQDDPDARSVAPPEQETTSENSGANQSADAIATTHIKEDPIYALLLDGDYDAVIRKTTKSNSAGALAMRALALLASGRESPEIETLVMSALDRSASKPHSADHALALIANGSLLFKRYQTNPSIAQLTSARDDFEQAVKLAPTVEYGQLALAEANSYVDPGVADQNIQWAEDLARRHGHPEHIKAFEQFEAKIMQE